jgi:hypothetical protein
MSSSVAWHGRVCTGGGEAHSGQLRDMRIPLRPGRQQQALGVGGHSGRHLVSFYAERADRGPRFGDERRRLLPHRLAVAAYRSAVSTEEEEMC